MHGETIIWASVTMRCASFSPTRFFQLAELAFVFDFVLSEIVVTLGTGSFGFSYKRLPFTLLRLSSLIWIGFCNV